MKKPIIQNLKMSKWMILLFIFLLIPSNLASASTDLTLNEKFVDPIDEGVILPSLNYTIEDDFEYTPTINDLIFSKMIVLDENIIDVQTTKQFCVGDFDSNDDQELLTFKTNSTATESYCKVQTYKKDSLGWIATDQEENTQMEGNVFLAQTGNFDTDMKDEVVIATLDGNFSRIYLVQYNPATFSYDITQIYQTLSQVKDLDTIKFGDQDCDKIVLLYTQSDEESGSIHSFVEELDLKDCAVSASTIILFEENIYWEKLSCGTFIESETLSPQIALYRADYYNQTIRNSILKVINGSGEAISNEVSLGFVRKIRDLTAWDYDSNGIQEIFLLESEFKDEKRGYNNSLTCFQVTEKKAIKKAVTPIYNRERLTVVKVGDLDNTGNKLFILDPPAGRFTYMIAIDEEYRTYLSGSSTRYAAMRSVFDVIESIYDSDVDIDAIWVGDHYYFSDGDTTGALFTDLVGKIPENLRRTHGADIIIGMIKDVHTGSELGLGSRPGHYCAIFEQIYEVILHETGHNFGLAKDSWHCSDSECIMYRYLSYGSTFCSICQNDINTRFFLKYPYDFEDEDIGTFPSGEDWYKISLPADGTVDVQNQDDHGNVLDLHKSGGDNWIYACNVPSKKMPVSDVGSVIFMLKPSASLMLYFHSDGGLIQAISYKNGFFRRGGYPGTLLLHYFPSALWHTCEFRFNTIDDSWKFIVNGYILTSKTNGGGSGPFTKFYISSFDDELGHIYLDDVMYEFEYDYPYDFEDDDIDSFPSGDEWFDYANEADGTIKVNNNQDGHGQILDLHKSGGTYRIYANNYPQEKMICEDEGIVTFMLKPSAPLILDFFSEGGVIHTLYFYSGTVRRNGYPGTSIGSYSSSIWYFCEFRFDISTNRWSFKMNGDLYTDRSDGGGSGDFSSFRISSFYSGGVNGHIFFDNLGYVFRADDYW